MPTDRILAGLQKAHGIGPAPRGGRFLPETGPDDEFLARMKSLPDILEGMGLPTDLGAGDVQGPARAVAIGGPEAIKGLKAAGKSLVDAMTRRGGIPRFESGSVSQPPTPLTAPIQEAVEIAQARWPRLFGHFTDITQTPSGWEQARGATIPYRADSRFASGGRSRSVLGLNSTRATPETVGHELLHAADFLSTPTARSTYETATHLPGGYAASAQEARARNMGSRFADIVGATQQARLAGTLPSGKNLRVPLRPEHRSPTSERTLEELYLSGKAAIKPPGR